MNKRIEFSEPTKRIISQRAAYICSFPGCKKILVGPGETPKDVLSVGEIAHIFWC